MKLALVCGTGPTLWADIGSLLPWIPPRQRVVAVNQAFELLWNTEVDALATCHPENIGRWIEHRRGLQVLARGFATAALPTIYASRNGEHVDEILTGPGRGSSGLLGVRVALHRGADKVICCGIPLTKSPHVAGSEKWGDRPWEEAHIHREGWEKAKANEFEDRVRSQSGVTREILGPATPAWLLD